MKTMPYMMVRGLSGRRQIYTRMRQVSVNVRCKAVYSLFNREKVAILKL